MGPPERRVIVFDPECDPGDDAMEFRLTYEGLLLSSSKTKTRADHKHQIRKAFHPQLKRLWSEHGALKSLAEPKRGASTLTTIADNFARNGFRFAPLIRREDCMFCELEVLLLRPGGQGSIYSEGDIDGKLKTLFDALRMPFDAQELANNPPAEGEDPFHCLLENDDLISKVTLEADSLLQLIPGCEVANSARVVIRVRTKPQFVTWGNISYG
jgi:hypothetical protein